MGEIGNPGAVELVEEEGDEAAIDVDMRRLGQQAVQRAQPAERVIHLTQNITFAAAMQAPDEIARAIRRQAAYGLAGARG